MSVNKCPSRHATPTNLRKGRRKKKIGNKTLLNERRYEKKQLPSIKKNLRTRVLRQLEIQPILAEKGWGIKGKDS